MIQKEFQHITLVGLGLIGASMASRLKSLNKNLTLRGVSSISTLEAAKKINLIDEGFSYDQNKGYESTDLIVLCTPISHIFSVLNNWKENKPNFKQGCVITDVGSTKKEICSLAESIFSSNTDQVFIGSHPMAGSEKSGFDARDPHLFENAAWILCPYGNTPSDKVNSLENLFKELGSLTVKLSPEIHDKMTAHVSHLPQIISTALAGFSLSRPEVIEKGLPISGGGFYDMTRLADSSFDMWEPIFKSNKNFISEILADFITYLGQIKNNFDKDGLDSQFKQGQDLRKYLHLRSRGFMREYVDLFVSIPDQPKAMESVLEPLSDEGLNISDLEILKVREGEGGTVRLSFRKLPDAEKAYKILKEKSLKVQLRD